MYIVNKKKKKSSEQAAMIQIILGKSYSQRTLHILQSYLPDGKPADEWHMRSAAVYGHAPLLQRAYEKRNSMNSVTRWWVNKSDPSCTSEHADLAAKRGYLAVVQCLRRNGIDCGKYGDGLMDAAQNGHADVVRDLITHGIIRTIHGAFIAAIKRGNVEVVREILQTAFPDYVSNEFPCEFINKAIVANNALEMVRLLRSYGFRWTSKAADKAAGDGKLDVIRDLRQHGIHCTEVGADWAVMERHMDVVRDLHANGVYCSVKAAQEAAREGCTEPLNLLMSTLSLLRDQAAAAM